MPTIDIPTTYTGDGIMLVSGADLNIIRDNARKIDGWSYRMHPAFDGQAGPDTGSFDYHPKNSYQVYRGCLRYRTGMTTLRIQGYAANYGGGPNSIRVYVYNANNAREDGGSYGSVTQTIPVSTNWSADIPLTGWSNDDFLFIDVQWNPSGYYDTMDVTDCYAGPVVLADTYPGTPAFTGSYPADKINQLTSVAQWLFTRMMIVPIYPTIAQMYRQATHKTPGINLWSGAVHKHYDQDAWRVELQTTCLTDKERLDLRLNGSVVWSSAWLSNEQSADIVHVHDLSAYAKGPIKAVLYANVDDGHVQPPNSRYTMKINRTEPLTNYPFATLPAKFPIALAISEVDLTARLNALSTIFANVKARIDADPFTWGVIRPMRRRYAQDAKQFSRVNKRYVHKFIRQGDRLVVRGKGLAISWGANTLEGEEDEEFKYQFAQSENITDGDKVETKTVALDSLNGLFPGVTYYVTGTDVHWCGEYMV